jgi:hypothetical protein
MTTDRPELVDTGNGYTVKYKGRFLYSSKHPIESIKKRVEGLSIGNNTLILIPSIGIGYGLKEILDILPPEAHVLCIEADECLYDFALHQTVNPIPRSVRLSMIRSNDKLDAVRILRKIGAWRFRRVINIPLAQPSTSDSQWYEDIKQLLEDEIQTFWKNKMTMVNLAPLWLKNIFANLSGSALADFSNLTVTSPILVAGAGPSLEESIAVIKKIEKKIVIVCVDTAYPELMKAGIKPDYIFILESQLANIHDFVPFPSAGIEAICDITSNPVVLRHAGIKPIFFSSEFASIALLERMERIGILPANFPALGSVGIAALFGALRMTKNPVFITGLDFCYSLGKTHAKGAPATELADISSSRLSPVSHKIFSAIESRPLLKITDKNGQPAISDLILSSYAKLVEQVARDEKNRIFDIGRYGMDLGLKRLRSDDEIIAALCRFPGEKPVSHSFGSDNDERCITTDKLSIFFKRELELLESAQAVIKPIVNGKKEFKTSFDEEERVLLKEIDYAYLHFPEANPEPVFEKTYLLRLLVSIVHYSELIKQALTNLDSIKK